MCACAQALRASFSPEWTAAGRLFGANPFPLSSEVQIVNWGLGPVNEGSILECTGQLKKETIMRLEFSPHVAFQVKDYPNAIRFYSEVMGMKLVEATEREAELKSGPMTFYAEAGEKGTIFFEFKTNNLAKAKEKFIEAGCRLVPETTPEGHESCYVYDPYGLVFHLFEDKSLHVNKANTE